MVMSEIFHPVLAAAPVSIDQGSHSLRASIARRFTVKLRDQRIARFSNQARTAGRYIVRIPRQAVLLAKDRAVLEQVKTPDFPSHPGNPEAFLLRPMKNCGIAR